jgi:hypothetical protein
LAIANAVIRNIVPLGGILFFGWSASNVLVLYFLDTMLAISVMFAGLMRYFMPPPKDDGWAARANAEAGYIATALALAAFFAVPMGMPVIFVLAGSDVTVGSLFADKGFRIGLVLQAIAAFWSCRDLYRALQDHTPEELRLKRHFGLVFLRWVAVLMVTYTGVLFLFGRYAPFAFVLAYTIATIVIDVAPDRFLRAMPGGDEDADSLPGDPPKPAATPEQRSQFAARWRRKHKR